MIRHLKVEPPIDLGSIFFVKKKKILVLDDKHFSRVCSAILEREGFFPETPEYEKISDTLHRWQEFGLVVASYPIAESFVEKIQESGTPVLVLSDFVNREVVEILKQFEVARCLIKPLDFEYFIGLVGEMLHGEVSKQGGLGLA
ncbi:response regulator [Geoalkalibacter halelectricus]|uniref:Response regulator n=1 Tax=Geoalkalibacter halelectricus TaxID=2847045 RepID=A0ABY5ZKH2_9BACT|nr:response regulator [Geoalkalibacter halelectricus]MDO3379694.1 response regulator [Geoalkalibacter halelectricus]UWZ79636.1 response regulator [Geoalkalibacter halelectricus]